MSVRLPASPPQYSQYADQQRTGILERELEQIRYLLTDRRWDDMKAAAVYTALPGTAADPDWDTAIGGWLFAGTGVTTQELPPLIFQLNHQWAEGTPLHPHIHWTKTTSAAGDVEWIMSYKWMRIGEVPDDWVTLYASEVVAGTPDTDTADKHLLSDFEPIDTTGAQVSDFIIVKISRDPTATNDTYEDDARYLEFDFHFTNDGRGSSEEFKKR